ncbi:MAG: hypothetical protein V3U92_04555 [Cellulophaga sp.]
MKLQLKLILPSLLGVMLFNACSTKKDALINRNWHALNTKYNVLYNGEVAFEEGREELNEAYHDNYWEILPIERLEVKDEIKLDSENNNPKFLLGEEKATKAIQKHSMDIKDIERNPRMADAFLLLGKTRYFDQRYIPALEAFNYVLRKYDQNDKLNEATIWREKVNIRLENEELAIKNLKRLLKFETVEDQEYADATAMMAQAYINLKVLDTAIQKLKIASAYTKKNSEKGRYYFIIGQLYNKLTFKDSANYAFDKVIALNRRSPRVYMINAHIQKIQNTEITEANREELLEYLTDLEENRENRPFLNKIYRQIAEFHLANKSDSLAIANYNKSLRATQNEPQLNALNYENLAEYNFDKNEYKIAGAYYDSTLTNLKENTKKFRTIKKKFDNLEDVIKYEEIVRHTDSIIELYNMPKEKQLVYFETFIDNLKKKEEAKAKKEEKKANTGFAAFAETKGGKENKGKFYFYNITSLGHGKTNFTTKWGKRVLEDNWRWSNKNTIQPTSDEKDLIVTTNKEKEATEEEKYTAAFYIDKIPTDIAIIDNLKADRNLANYQLGLIYKEKFKEDLLATNKLVTVLESNPEERLIIPSKYNLYKIYEAAKSPLMAEMKEDIIKNHPKSRYAEILLNPQAILANSSDSPSVRYTVLYKLYKNQEYLKVITAAEENINRYTGEKIVAKFEMLKANAIGRVQGFDAFKEALNYVALNYPNNPEGKKAQQMIAEQLPKLAPKEFSKETESSGSANWKVIFPFKRRDNEKALKLVELLEKSIKDLKYRSKVSKDIYNLEDQFVVVHGFKSKDYALGYSELLKNNKDYKVRDENFVILSSNYKIIQVHKTLKDYKEQL